MTSAFICAYLRLKENSGSMAKTVNGCGLAGVLSKALTVAATSFGVVQSL